MIVNIKWRKKLYSFKLVFALKLSNGPQTVDIYPTGEGKHVRSEEKDTESILRVN